MAAKSSKLVLWGAITGNAVIAISKFVAAVFTGSSAMISEGIHSVVDTGNGVLMLMGIARSKRPADARHPFGHGKELYFWTLIVALIIFGLGGGMSVYEGIRHIIHPSPQESPLWNYVVLGIALVFETISWGIALKEFLAARKDGRGVWKTVRLSKDPTVFVVLFEDSAALAGILVAFLGVWLGHRYHLPALDGMASVLIGFILGAVAIVLARESKSLLIGERADQEAVEEIRRIVQSDSMVDRASTPLTMHLSPEEVLLNIDLKFSGGITVGEIEEAVDRIERRIREKYPEVARIYIEAEALKEADRSGPAIAHSE